MGTETKMKEGAEIINRKKNYLDTNSNCLTRAL